MCLDQELYIQQLLERLGIGECDPIASPADHKQKLTKKMSSSSEEERKQIPLGSGGVLHAPGYQIFRECCQSV